MIPQQIDLDAGYWLGRLQRGEQLTADEAREAAAALRELHALAHQADDRAERAEARLEEVEAEREETRRLARERQARRRSRVATTSDHDVTQPSDVDGTSRDVTQCHVTERDVTDTTPSSPVPRPSPAPPTHPLTPSTPGLLAARCSAREATTPTEPAEPIPQPPTAPPPATPTGEIAGVIIGDLRQWAIQLTTAANQGITAARGEQPMPIRADAQLDAAERIMATGVELEFARSVVHTAAQEAAVPGKRVPRSLSYFVARVGDAWAAELERRRARETPDPAPLPAAPADSGPRGRRAAQTAALDQAQREAEAELRRLEAAERAAAAPPAEEPAPPDQLTIPVLAASAAGRIAGGVR